MHCSLYHRTTKLLLLATLLSMAGCGSSNNFESSSATPSPDAFSYVVVVGDSIGAASRAQTAYPNYMLAPGILQNQAMAGTRLTVEISAMFTDNLDLFPLADSVVIQGGVNDLHQWDEATPAYNAKLQLMQQTVETMVSEAMSRGLSVMLVNIAPWQGNSNWSPVKQQLTEDFNAWLAAYAVQTGSVLTDAYDLLLDQSGATKGIDVLFGGPLHPNEVGAELLGQAADAQIIALR